MTAISEELAVHVADQGGATLRGDRPAVLIDLPGGERFTAIVPPAVERGDSDQHSYFWPARQNPGRDGADWYVYPAEHIKLWGSWRISPIPTPARGLPAYKWSLIVTWPGWLLRYREAC